MHEDLYSHKLIKPLLNTGPAVPAKAIEELSAAIEKNKTLSRRCNNLFRFESSFNATQSPGSYMAVWLAFALARARDEEAISSFIDLFSLVDPVEHDMLWELAQFALWQYGDRAVREVLEDFWRVVDMDYTGYYLGVLEVIGMSQDQLLRRRVADLVIEALKAPGTAPAALMGLVDIALILEERRLPSILNRWSRTMLPDEQKVLEEAERVLLDADSELRSNEFNLPWTELAEFSSEHFTSHFKAGPHDVHPGEPSGGLTESFRELAQSFRQSSRFLELPKPWSEDPEKMVQLLIRIFSLLYDAFSTLPDEADAQEIGDLMENVLPRRMVGNLAAFQPIPHLLMAFFHYLTDSYSREEGEEFATYIRASEAEMFRRAADPDCWDGTKILAMEKFRD